MPKHVFTPDERQRGHDKTVHVTEHQERAFEALKAKRPDCWRWIYKNRVKPYMQGKNGH